MENKLRINGSPKVIQKESIADYLEKITERIADRISLVIEKLGLEHLSEEELAARIEKSVVKKYDGVIILEEYYTFDKKPMMKMTLYANFNCEIDVYDIELDGKEQEE